MLRSRMIKSFCLRISFFVFSAIPLTIPVFAQEVKTIHPTGILEFENGEQVSLAGVIIPVESLMLLSVIVSGKNLSVQTETSGDYEKQENPKAAYLYVKTFELDFPFKPQSEPKESHVMINQLLLSLGLARVDGDKIFKHREQFLKIEAEARTQGHGIWSYENPPQ